MDDKYYERKGKKYTRVTSVLGGLSKQWLGAWGAKIGMEKTAELAVHELAKIVALTLDRKEILQSFKDAVKNIVKMKVGFKEMKRISQEAMDIGSQIHYFFEGWFSQSDWATRVCEGEHKDRIGKVVQYFVEHGLKPVESELTLFSDELLCAGTADLVLEDKKGDIYILDYKSGHEGETDILQIAAYRDFYLLENSLNFGDKQVHGILCYTGKNPGDKVKFVEYNPSELDEAFKIFKHAHAIHCYLKGDANEGD